MRTGWLPPCSIFLFFNPFNAPCKDGSLALGQQKESLLHDPPLLWPSTVHSPRSFTRSPQKSEKASKEREHRPALCPRYPLPSLCLFVPVCPITAEFELTRPAGWLYFSFTTFPDDFPLSISVAACQKKKNVITTVTLAYNGFCIPWRVPGRVACQARLW